MPGFPPLTIAEAAHTYKPVDTLVLQTSGRLSILDTVFISKRSRRAVYATTTSGPHTSLWRVAGSGTMTEIAKIDWEYEVRTASAGDGSLRNGNQPTKRCSMLTFGGRKVRTEDFLQKGRGWFSSDSRTFSANNTEYKWKSGTENAGLSSGQHAGHLNILYHETVKIWRCILARPSSSNSSPKAAPRTSSSAPYLSGSPIAGVRDSASLAAASADPLMGMTASSLEHPLPFLTSSSPAVTQDHDHEVSIPPSGISTVISPILSAPAPPTLLARFALPQPGLVRNEICLFPPALDFSSDEGQSPHLLECLLVSAVILAATKGEWKQVQSSIDASSLQKIFVAEAVGDVPPYTPGTGRTTEGPPITAPRRTYSVRSRKICEYLVREESQLATSLLLEDSDRVPLIPRRSSRQTSRSNRFSFFPTSRSEIQTSINCANGVYPSDPERGAQRSVVSRRPVTAYSTPASDDAFPQSRPPLQAVNAAKTPTWAPRQRPSTASGTPSRPISSPPTMYKGIHGARAHNHVT